MFGCAVLNSWKCSVASTFGSMWKAGGELWRFPRMAMSMTCWKRRRRKYVLRKSAQTSLSSTGLQKQRSREKKRPDGRIFFHCCLLSCFWFLVYIWRVIVGLFLIPSNFWHFVRLFPQAGSFKTLMVADLSQVLSMWSTLTPNQRKSRKCWKRWWRRSWRFCRHMWRRSWRFCYRCPRPTFGFCLFQTISSHHSEMAHGAKRSKHIMRWSTAQSFPNFSLNPTYITGFQQSLNT